MKLKTTVAILVGVSIVMMAGCVNKLSPITGSSSGEVIKYSKVDVNLHPLDKTVCDPFSGNPADTLDNGIKATLYYSIAGTPRMYSSLDYTSSKAQKSNQTLFFTDLNVPTRIFTQGFSTKTSDVLKDDSGNVLIEYFGLRFETLIKLGANDDEGDYEIGILSDDGVTLKQVSGTPEQPVYNTIISNDGDHSTILGCASQIVHMTRDLSLPILLTYYQGPREEIANVVMWRKASTPGTDPLCGKGGNNYYFDEGRNSAPLKPFNDLVARGWKVLTKDNFFIPKDQTYNPCVKGTPPVITNFLPGEAFPTSAIFSWTTDIPATSQIKLVNKATGEVILTQADNALRTSHIVTVTGLQSKTTYTAQAVSISEDLGNSMSTVIEITTH